MRVLANDARTPRSRAWWPAVVSWSRDHAAAGCVAGVVISVSCFVVGSGYDYDPFPSESALPSSAEGAFERSPGSDAARENRRLRSALARVEHQGTYVVVDRANNRLYLRRGESILLEAICSSGSGAILHAPDGTRKWVFDTPAGVFRIKLKTENPVWRKPDWAFLEEGRPVPGRAEERIEYGSLGEYALHFGDGYMIHGTLYERLLGRSVTHGCIRLGRDDLRKVFEATAPGTPVYIF